jgi:hypothetical protein
MVGRDRRKGLTFHIISIHPSLNKQTDALNLSMSIKNGEFYSISGGSNRTLSGSCAFITRDRDHLTATRDREKVAVTITRLSAEYLGFESLILAFNATLYH